MQLARLFLLGSFATLAACLAKEPRINGPVGLDDPNKPVAAANRQVSLPPPESQIAIELHAEAKERCESEALVSPHFDFNSTEVRPTDNAAIRAVASCLVNGPLAGAYVTLVGHADATGNEQYDEMLARARAETVLRFLVARGVDQATIRVRASVDATPRATEPAFPGDAARGYPSRRVDIFIQR